MNNFVYIAHDLAGKERKGLKRSSSQFEVYAWLHSHGFIPIEVKPLTSVVAKKSRRLAQKKPKYAETAAFCWQLATMVEGGVLITEAIDTIAEDMQDSSLRNVLIEISEQIKKGQSFSSSVAQYPRVFSKLFCAMILAGETSGSLPTILVRLAEYYDTRDKFARKVKIALTYPAFVVAFVFLILVVMMTVIIPRFRLIFNQMGGELPAFTQSFMTVYDVIAANITYIMIALFLSSSFLFVYGQTQKGHMILSKLMLSLPLLGKLISQAFIATFCKTMATLLEAGVSVIESFDILGEMTNNDVIRGAVSDSKHRIIEGLSLSVGMATTGFFPNMIGRMVEVGEKSGSLPRVLSRASRYYETKMDTTITTLLNCLGPLVIIFVGAIVLVVVVALYLPVFSMSDITI
ncbi:MAG: type II secretion system F family protein [Planctomycetota bacterium]|jgi:type IV pilus assembly protein PilC